ncbi:MAG: RNA methyltransferase [Reinekea sp.]
MLSNIRIVLIKTWHAGNIGAVARAMKNMGLSQLYLVDPIDFPCSEATSRAGQATDLLDQAVVVNSLEQAIDDCSLVIGTSARDRSIRLPALTAEQCARKTVAESKNTKVAVVFGRERMGLLNEEIQQCHFQVNIEANPEYPVLNISQAVQIICYEIFKAQQQTDLPLKSTDEPYPLQKELRLFQQHLKETAHNIGFLNKQHEGQVLEHLNALFRRARLTRKELSILRGFLSAIEKETGSQ